MKVCILLPLLVLSSAALSQEPPPPDSKIHGPYIDDDDQRQLADLTLSDNPEQPGALKILISSTGPQVEAIGGYRGVAGSNRYTAEELSWIESATHSSEVFTRYKSGDSHFPGKLMRGRVGTIRERRLKPDGRIDFLATTPTAYVLELHVDTAVDKPGLRTTIVMVNEQPRLRCRYNIVDGRITELQLQSLGSDHDVAYAPPPSDLIPVGLQQEDPPVAAKEWEKRDKEARWVFMQKDLLAHPERATNWITFLTKTENYDLLEWVAIYQPDAFRSLGVGNLLADHKAPQWLRVAAWHCTSPPNFGHSLQAATGILIKKHPAVAEHWLKVHQHEFDNWETALAEHYQSLLQDKIAPTDSSQLLPPLKANDVFRYLDAPAEVAEFGDRIAVDDPQSVYVHQVERAIDGVVVSGRRSPELLNRVRALIHHANSQIQQKALLAFSYFAPQMAGSERFNDFLSIVDDADEDPRLVEAALIGYSYHPHPSVVLKLHQIAEKPGHAGWNAAVSRIGDLGKEFSIGFLESIDTEAFSEEQTAIYNDAMTRLKTLNSPGKAPAPWQTFNNMSLAAFATQADSPYAAAIRKSVVDSGQRMTAKNRRKLNQWNMQNLNDIWLPGPEKDFSRLLDQIRGEIIQDTE